METPHTERPSVRSGFELGTFLTDLPAPIWILDSNIKIQKVFTFSFLYIQGYVEHDVLSLLQSKQS